MKKTLIDNQQECSRCYQWKELKDFYRNKRLSTGYNSHCKVCDDALRKAHRALNPGLEGRVRDPNKIGQPAKAIVDGKQLCGRCSVWKPVDEYTKSKKSKTGLSYRCKGCDLELYLAYVEADSNKQKRRNSTRRWRKANPEKRRAYKNNYARTNLLEKLRIQLRGRLNKAIKAQRERDKAQAVPKQGSAVRDLGCTIPELIAYLAAKFQPGMSWENWGLGDDKWHIDHIKPLASFDLTDREQVKQACHYTNLQPLWSRDNLAKGDKILS